MEKPATGSHGPAETRVRRCHGTNIRVVPGGFGRESGFTGKNLGDMVFRKTTYQANPMPIVINGHSIELDLLPKRPLVLDVGCRGFAFGNAIKRLRPRSVIYELDIDDLDVPWPYNRAGIAHYDGTAGCSQEQDGEWRHIVPGSEVPIYTLKTFSKMAGVDRWDLIKLDCEGSEYEILKSFDRPWATQLTVEFHQHTQFRRKWAEIDRIIKHISKWYTVARHERDAESPGGGNYWDSLFIAMESALQRKKR